VIGSNRRQEGLGEPVGAGALRRHAVRGGGGRAARAEPARVGRARVQEDGPCVHSRQHELALAAARLVVVGSVWVRGVAVGVRDASDAEDGEAVGDVA